MIASRRAAVAGPTVAPQAIRREGDHSRCARCAAGMCAGSVLGWCLTGLRTWLAPRLTEPPHRATVEALEQERDRGLQLGERVEDAVAERGENPALGQEHALFDLRLVPGVVRARRQDYGAVV